LGRGSGVMQGQFTLHCLVTECISVVVLSGKIGNKRT
jgi:hypothetical protein